MYYLEMVTNKKVQALEARIIDLENKINSTTNKGA
jgi:BMFP domain-containing protein YqiC